MIEMFDNLYCPVWWLLVMWVVNTSKVVNVTEELNF